MDEKFNMFIETVDERFRSFVNQIDEYLTANGLWQHSYPEKQG